MTQDPSPDLSGAPKHRAAGMHAPGRERIALIALLPGPDDAGASHFRRRQLDAFIDDAHANGSLLVRVAHGTGAAGSDASDIIEVTTNQADAFDNSDLSRKLQLRGVTQVVVAGLESDRVTATLRGAKQAGLAASVASLTDPPPVGRHQSPHEVADPAHVRKPAAAASSSSADAAGKAGKPSPAASSIPETPNGLDALASEPSPPLGASAEGVEPDHAGDPLAWDDTWALKGEPQPGSSDADEHKGRVRNWLEKKAEKKLHDKD